MKAEELQLFFHMLRMNNSLRSMHKLHMKIGKGPDRLENIKDQIDLHFTAIALYHGAIRTFLGSIYPRIKRYYVSAEDKAKIAKLKDRLNHSEQDAFLHVADIIRDKIAFHFDCDIINKYITDDEPATDLLIGYGRSRLIYDCVFLEPYSSIFAYLAENIPPDVDKRDVANWITNTSIAEIDSFCSILERIVGSFFKRNGRLEESTLEKLLS